MIQKLVVERLTAARWITSGGIASKEASPGKMAQTSWRFKFTPEGLEKTKQLLGLLDDLGFTAMHRVGELDCLLMLLRPYGLGGIGPDDALDQGRR